MPLIPMTTLLENAVRRGYGVGYFEAWDGYSLEAVLEAAEEEAAPVILGFGCMMADRGWIESGGIEAMAGLGLAAANRSRVPVSLLFNEAQTFEQAAKALDLGFNAVMLDTSESSPDEAKEAVARLVALAHAKGVSVEAECGSLPDAGLNFADPDEATGDDLTDPDEAAAFLRETGADFLSVSIGNVHLLTGGTATVDLDRLRQIRRKVSVPFVIHGGSGFPPDAIPDAIACGAAKFNVGTILKHVFAEGIRQSVGNWPSRIDVHEVLGSHKAGDFMKAGKAAMKAKTKELIHLYGSDGRASDE